MEWYQIVSLVLSVLSVSTIASLIWRDIYEKRKANSRHVRELERQEKREMVRSIIQEEVQNLEKKVDGISDTLNKIGSGTLSGLRNDILKCYYDCVNKGYRNDYDYTNIYDLYEAYKELNGNSFVADVMERFDALPTKEEFRSKDKKGGSADEK